MKKFFFQWGSSLRGCNFTKDTMGTTLLKQYITLFFFVLMLSSLKIGEVCYLFYDVIKLALILEELLLIEQSI